MADSYTALYRELRPKRFGDIVAQEHIKRTLRNQIISGRISHAYLFCGTKGTGKTSTAQVFARAVNCTNLTEDGEPCGVDGETLCRSCDSVMSGRSLDVIEIDAASNNGVDNIRDIREDVKYPPTHSRYRVFIIDEVHMLSAGAFNALLKTLEEPPEHVIFILATTDFQKVPPTILSRCQRFDFRRIPAKEIAGCIQRNLDKKTVSIDNDAIDYIAKIAEGSLRDAFSILDQCISCYYGERITLAKVQENLGAVDDGVYFDMVDALNGFDGGRCVGIIDRISADGRDIGQFVTDFIMHLRNLLVSAVSPQSVDASPETIERLRAQATGIDSGILMSYVSSFSATQSQMRYAPNPKALLEVGCLKLCNPQASGDYSALQARLQKIETALESGTLFSMNGADHPNSSEYPKSLNSGSSNTSKSETESKAGKSADPVAKNRELSEISADVKMITDDEHDKKAKEVKDGWRKFTGVFEMALKPLLNTAKPEFIAQTLYIVCENGQESVLKSKNDLIGSKLKEVFGDFIDFQIVCSEDFTRLSGIKKADSKTKKQTDKVTADTDSKEQSNSGDEMDEMLKKINFDVEIE